jgi:hypothetical protein
VGPAAELQRLGPAQPGSVLIVGPDWDGQVPEPANWTLWYFGRDYRRFLELSSAPGVRTIVSLGALLNETAKRLRPEIVALESLLASGRFPLSWSASDTAELNPVTSDLHLDLCRGIALIEAARSGGDHLVVVDDNSLGRSLVDLCRCSGITARWWGAKWSAMRAFYYALRGHAVHVQAFWRRRRLLRRIPAYQERTNPADACLLTWIDRRTFVDGPALETDRFLGKLPTWLRAVGIPFSWLGNVLGPPDGLEEAAARARCSERLDVTAALFDVRGLVRAYGLLLAFPFAVRRRSSIAGTDVTPLVRRAVRMELASTRLIFAVQYFGLARAMKARGMTPRIVLYTYENQPWEKQMLAGFRRALPATVLVGVQHAPFAASYLAPQPTARQWRDETTPDLLATIGEEFRDRLIAHGAPPARVIVGGALRYPSILDKRSCPLVPTDGATRRVLAACSYDLQEALELVQKAAAATAGVAELIVNFHPMVDEGFRATLREQVTKEVDGNHLSFVEGNADVWLGKVDVVLYNASGTSFEAVSAGIPTIFVGSEIALDIDKMEGQGGLQCRSAADLRRHIGALLNDAKLRRDCVEAGRRFLSRCFAIPNPEVWTELATQGVKGRRA